MIIVMWVRGKEKLKGSTQKMKEKRNSIGVSGERCDCKEEHEW